MLGAFVCFYVHLPHLTRCSVCLSISIPLNASICYSIAASHRVHKSILSFLPFYLGLSTLYPHCSLTNSPPHSLTSPHITSPSHLLPPHHLAPSLTHHPPPQPTGICLPATSPWTRWIPEHLVQRVCRVSTNCRFLV